MRRLPDKKRLFIPLAILALALICAILYYPNLGNKLASAAYSRSLRAFYFPVLELFRDVIFTVSFWLVILFTLGLQLLLPAKPNQKLFSLNFRQDLVWFFYEAVLHAVIVVTYVELLRRLYAKFFSGLTISAFVGTPGWLRFVVALLLIDFLYWTQHYFTHKVPALWELHKLHHSQKELNFFTDFRYHVLEYVVRHTFLVIPFLVLQVEAPVIASFAIFRSWYTRFYHGNIRTNLGPLRYILVTPQSHRIHHSIEPGHRDTNYGAILSIWDWIGGTQCRDSDAYPDTGIDDELFPHEQETGIRSLLVTPVRQMLYPFAAVGNRRDALALPSGADGGQPDSVNIAEESSWTQRATSGLPHRVNLEFGDRIDEVSIE